jgi:class 3 adenylate cyclase
VGKKRAEGILRTSVVLDPLMIVGLLVPTIIDTSNPAPHIGIVHEIPLYAFLLTAVTSGVRLSLGAAKIGIVANAMAFVTAVALDEIVWAGRLPYGPRVVLWPTILLLGASVFAWDLVHRMRQLATEGANAMLFAERAKNRLRSYVSEGVAEDAMRASQISMTGHQIEVAVLFSDLRGFTAYAERLAPDQLVVQLNAYFEAMLVAITAEGGTVDKYIGDAIMVVFPQSELGDGAARAIRAAHAMQLRLEAHNVERGKIGLSRLRQGIGIHFGLAIAGNVGTPEKLQHTVMGDVVNVASRLEGATKKHQTSVFISKETVDAAARSEHVVLPKLRVYGKIEIVGRDSEVEVFTLDDPSSAMSIPPERVRTA